MNQHFKKQIVSLATVIALIAAPTFSAHADDYAKICQSGDTTSSDQTKAYCEQAKSGKISKDYNTAKEVVMSVATASLIVAGATLYGNAFCPAINYAASGVGLGLDIAASIKLKSASSTLMSSMTTIGSTMATSGAENIGKAFGATFGASNTIRSGAAGAAKGSAGKEAGKKAASTCYTAAIGTGIQAAMAEIGREQGKKTQDTAMSSASDIVNSRNSPGFQVGDPTKTSNEAGKAAGAVAKDAVATDCGSQGGNNYLKCIGQVDPEMAAITNSPDAMNALESTLGGKSLGDFAKGFDGNGSQGDLANYVANGMGLGAPGAEALTKALDTSKQAALDADLYKPGTFSSNGAKVASTGGEDLDFNKMMAGMLKQLNPDADKKGEDPANIVFRQLDLLPADKIEANKDISLFARIGYRYRKKSTDMEQLNWSRPENQTSAIAPSDARSPASVH